MIAPTVMVSNQTPIKSLWVLTLIYRVNHLAHIVIAPGNTRIRNAALSGRGYGISPKTVLCITKTSFLYLILQFESNT